jgi:hypothetical protein
LSFVYKEASKDNNIPLSLKKKKKERKKVDINSYKNSQLAE